MSTRAKVDPGSCGIRFGPDVLAALEREAHRRRMKVGPLVREIVLAFLRGQQIPVAHQSDQFDREYEKFVSGA